MKKVFFIISLSCIFSQHLYTYSMQAKRHIGQEILPIISHYQGIYTIENVRDFRWETEHAAKQHFLTMNIKLDHIVGCRLYQSLFWYKDIYAHYMLGFTIKDPVKNSYDEVILSIEARRPQWDNYSLWKGIIPHMYDIIYIRWTPQDLLWLRKDVRKEPLHSYTIKLSQAQSQDLFSYLASKTNTLVHKPLSYHAIRYNCLTDLHKWLWTILSHLKHSTVWTVFAKWYINYLIQKDIINKE